MSSAAMNIVDVLVGADQGRGPDTESDRDSCSGRGSVAAAHLAAIDIIATQLNQVATAGVSSYADPRTRRLWTQWVTAAATATFGDDHAQHVMSAAIAAGLPHPQLVTLIDQAQHPCTVNALANALVATGKHVPAWPQLAGNYLLNAATRQRLLHALVTNHQQAAKRCGSIADLETLTDVDDDTASAYLRLAPRRLVMPTHPSSVLVTRPALADTVARRILSLNESPKAFPAAALLLLAHPHAATSTRLRRRLAYLAERVVTSTDSDGRASHPVQGNADSAYVALTLAGVAGRADSATAATDALVERFHLLSSPGLLRRWLRVSAADVDGITDLLTRLETLTTTSASRGRSLANTAVTELARWATPSALAAALPHLSPLVADQSTADVCALAKPTQHSLSSGPRDRYARFAAGLADQPQQCPVTNLARTMVTERAAAGDITAFAASESMAKLGRWPGLDDQLAVNTFSWSVVRQTRLHLLRPQLLAAHQVAGAAGAQMLLDIERSYAGKLPDLVGAVATALAAADT